MIKVLSDDHVLRKYFSKKACRGLVFPTERVLFWEDGKAVFQSVTAYGTDMKLLTVDDSSSNWSYIANFDFKNKKSIMFRGLKTDRPEISRINVQGTIAPDYTLACGTKRIAICVKKSVSEHRPKPLRKQCFHKDGPTRYDGKQFDGHGNILHDARGHTTRTIPLPPGISLSALFAFFCRTFLGIKPLESKKPKHERSSSCSSSSSLRLHASIGRAIIFGFDTDHQVWRQTMYDVRICAGLTCFEGMEVQG